MYVIFGLSTARGTVSVLVILALVAAKDEAWAKLRVGLGRGQGVAEGRVGAIRETEGCEGEAGQYEA